MGERIFHVVIGFTADGIAWLFDSAILIQSRAAAQARQCALSLADVGSVFIGYPIRQIRDFVIVEVCVRGEAGWPYDAYRCSYKFQQTAAITCTARGRVIHVPYTVIGTSIGQRKCPSVISCRLALDWSCPAPPICGACCAYIAEL